MAVSHAKLDSAMPHTTPVKLKNGQAALRKLYANPRYRGKHVLVIAGQVYVARTGAEASRQFDRATRAHPHARPTLAYIPKADALVL